MHLRTLTAICLAALAAGSGAAQDDLACDFRPAFTRADEKGTQRVQVYQSAADSRIGGARALLFISPLKVNTDGTRKSYNARDPRARTIAINNILNAMPRGKTIAQLEAAYRAGWPLPETWTILSTGVIERNRVTGKPCIDSAGYPVSKTSEVAVRGGFARDGDCDQSKWLDALEVNALVLPKGSTEFEARNATNRTPVVAMTLNPARRVALGIVGDKGPVAELGEASVAMNRTLNGLPDDALPANYADAVARFQAPRSAVLLFPGAAHKVAYPLSRSSVNAATGAIFERWGGKRRLEACIAQLGQG
jgi:hypothetical protein